MKSVLKTDHSNRSRWNDLYPPVIILNLSYSGLGIARELEGRGVRVIGLSSDRRGYGNFTRACEVRFAPDAQNHGIELAEFLTAAASELRTAVIFPTSDFDVQFLNRFRAELEPNYHLSIPSSDCLSKVMDKHALFRAATNAGVAVPSTMTIASSMDIARACEEIGFPCVVKPISSIDWRKKENTSAFRGAKAVRAVNVDALKEAYDQVAHISPSVLVQEWIAGDTDQIVVLGGYADQSSELLAYFTAQKIIQSPEEFGTGCLVEAVDVPQLLEPTRRLLRVLGYRGLAEVEYKYDRKTGDYKLIEINPRHWDWHQLGDTTGVNLTWTAYCDLTGRPVERVCPQSTGAKWIAEDTLVHYVFQHALAGQIDARRMFDKLSGKRMYGIFAWNDPLPFVYSLRVGLPRLGKKLFTALGHKAGLFSILALAAAQWSVR